MREGLTYVAFAIMFAALLWALSLHVATTGNGTVIRWRPLTGTTEILLRPKDDPHVEWGSVRAPKGR